jgi:hypothetical protein
MSSAYLVPLSYAIVGLVNLLPLGHIVAAVEAWEFGEPIAHVSGIAVAERVEVWSEWGGGTHAAFLMSVGRMVTVWWEGVAQWQVSAVEGVVVIRAGTEVAERSFKGKNPINIQ